MKNYFILSFLIVGCNLNSIAQTQAEMNKTAQLEYQKADTELNIVYKQLMTILDDNEKKMLVQAEKDWVKFRDSHCKFDASQYEGGSIQPLIYFTCLEELTRTRIEEIKASIKDRNF